MHLWDLKSYILAMSKPLVLFGAIILIYAAAASSTYFSAHLNANIYNKTNTTHLTGSSYIMVCFWNTYFSCLLFFFCLILYVPINSFSVTSRWDYLCFLLFD